MRIVRLAKGDVALIGAIDRSEHVDLEYAVIDGQLRERPVTISEVPSWERSGTGPHSVHAQITFCASLIADGAVLFGGFAEEVLVGVAVVDPSFEARMAWLAFLYVDRLHRRRGVARALWDACVELGLESGAESIYISAVPTGSAVGFYLRQGCHLANPPHPYLLEHEPDDIHFARALR